MRRMIRLAAERGNREGPLSLAVEQVPYPTPVDPEEAWALPIARGLFAQLRQHRSSETNPPGPRPPTNVQTTVQH